MSFEDPARVEFCRALKEGGIDMEQFHREKLFYAIDKLIERRIEEHVRESSPPQR